MLSNVYWILVFCFALSFNMPKTVPELFIGGGLFILGMYLGDWISKKFFKGKKS